MTEAEKMSTSLKNVRNLENVNKNLIKRQRIRQKLEKSKSGKWSKLAIQQNCLTFCGFLFRSIPSFHKSSNHQSTPNQATSVYPLKTFTQTFFFSHFPSLLTINIALHPVNSRQNFYGSGKWATDDLTFVFKLNWPRASTTSFIATITFDSAHFTTIISVPRCRDLLHKNFFFLLCRFWLL